jgi:hypothetical protein
VVFAQKPPSFDGDVFYFPFTKKFVKITETEYKKMDKDVKENYYKDKYISFSSLNRHVEELNKYYQEEMDALKDSISKVNNELDPLKLNKVDEILSDLPYSNIGNLSYATQAIDKELIEKLIPAIKQVKTLKFQEVTENREAAYCFNSFDGNGDFGVQLNAPAIAKLMEVLRDSKFWNIPTKDEMDLINKNLSGKKISAFEALASSEQNPYFKWKKPGRDFYNMKLLPWGYRFNSQQLPIENQNKSCNFAAIDLKEGIDFINDIGMIKLEDNGSLLEFMVKSNDEGAYGVYVLLFRNKNIKK